MEIDEIIAPAVANMRGRAPERRVARIGRVQDDVIYTGAANEVYITFEDSPGEWTTAIVRPDWYARVGTEKNLPVEVVRQNGRNVIVDIPALEGTLFYGGGVPSTSPSGASVITRKVEGVYANAFSLGSLTSGLLAHNVVDDESTPRTAVPSTDYVAPNSGANVINNGMIADNAVTTAKVQDNAITSNKILSLVASKITGLLSYLAGGTGTDLSILTNNSLLTKGAAAVGGLAPGASGTYVRSNGTVYQAAPIVNADLPVVGKDKGGTGTNLSGISYGGLLINKTDGTMTVHAQMTSPSAPTGANNAAQGYGTESRWWHYDPVNNINVMYRYISETGGVAVWDVEGEASGSVDLSSPPPIGDVAPNTGAFTEVHVGSGAFLVDITPSLVEITAANDSAFPVRRHKRARTGVTAVQNGNNLGSDNWDAYNGTSYLTVAEIRAVATENHGATNRGAKLVARTTRNGTAIPFDALTFEDDGTLNNLVRGLSQVLSGVFYVQNAQQAVTSTAAETSLANATNATGTRIFPANWWKVNKVVRTKIGGVIRGNTANAIVLRAKSNTTELASMAIGGINYGVSDVPCEIECTTLCTSVGVSGNMRTQFRFSVSGYAPFVSAVTNIAVNTTIAQTLDFTADWTNNTATERIAADILMMEALN